MTKQPPEGMTVSLVDESDIYNWQVTMEGPEGSLYAVSFIVSRQRGLLHPKLD